LKRKSGARYRLNRWREDRVANGVKITYRDLVREYVRLSQTAGPFPQVPHGRYINFLSDFMAGEQSATSHERRRVGTARGEVDLLPESGSAHGGRYKPTVECQQVRLCK
jgi:hypothetical protein